MPKIFTDTYLSKNRSVTGRNRKRLVLTGLDCKKPVFNQSSLVFWCLLHSRITGQLCFHLRASRDIPTDANSCLWPYQAYASLFPPDFTSRQFLHKSVSIITSHLGLSYVNGLRHYITLPYGLGILGVASHRVTTQMTYFTTCLFHVPCGTSVLLFLYLMRLVSLVTYLFHLTLFKHQVLVCLSQFEISS